MGYRDILLASAPEKCERAGSSGIAQSGDGWKPHPRTTCLMENERKEDKSKRILMFKRSWAEFLFNSHPHIQLSLKGKLNTFASRGSRMIKAHGKSSCFLFFATLGLYKW